MANRSRPKITKNSKTSLPFFLFSVKAGFPSPAEEDIEKRIDLNQLLIRHPAATFFVKVDGNSMKDANIHDQDILIVDRAIEPTDGKIVVAIINSEFTVKRIRMIKNRLFLEAENPQFAPLEILPEWDFQIWGVVTYIIHKAL